VRENFQELAMSFVDKIDNEDIYLDANGIAILALHEAICRMMHEFEQNGTSIYELEPYTVHCSLSIMRINIERIIQEFEPKLMGHINELLGIDNDEIE
jgi:hypothetical protein